MRTARRRVYAPAVAPGGSLLARALVVALVVALTPPAAPVARAADADRLAVVDAHREYLCEETLALHLTLGEPPAGFAVQRVPLDGSTVVVGLRRAESAPAP